MYVHMQVLLAPVRLQQPSVSDTIMVRMKLERLPSNCT